MGNPVGRNDPCPCGSGKKFKRCCGATAHGLAGVTSAPRGEPVAGWARAHAIWPKTREVLLPHAINWLGKVRLVESIEEFEGPDVRDEENADWLELFLSWQFYDWIPEGETATVAAHWLADGALADGRDLNVLRMVKSASEHPLSFFQVQALDPGRGVVLRNLLTDEEGFVVDRSLSESLPPWTIIVARQLEFSGITFFDAVGPRALPPDFADEIASFIEERLECALPMSREALLGCANDVLECYMDAVAADERRSFRPLLHTTDGELLVMCKDRWRIAKGARKSVLERLLDLGLEVDGPRAKVPTKLVWLKQRSEALPTVLGKLTLERAELVIEVNSRERRERMKAMLAEGLGDLVEHSGSEEQSAEALFAGATPSDPTMPDEAAKIPPEVAQQVLREYLTKHYAGWPDEKLPALRGKTPRQAVKTGAGRAEVKALIQEMEHRSHGTPMSDAYDFDDLRRVLGLEPARGPLG